MSFISYLWQFVKMGFGYIGGLLLMVLAAFAMAESELVAVGLFAAGLVLVIFGKYTEDNV